MDGCAICFNTRLREPTKISCGHLFCQRCIKTYYNTKRYSEPEDTVGLPDAAWVGQNGIAYFRTNGVTQRLENAYHLSSPNLAIKPGCPLCRKPIESWKIIQQSPESAAKCMEVIAEAASGSEINQKSDSRQPHGVEDSQPSQVDKCPSPVADIIEDVLPTGRQPIEVVNHDSGRGKSIKYSLKWSDGTVSQHSKAFLVDLCPDLLKKHQLKSRALNTAKWRANMTDCRSKQE